MEYLVSYADTDAGGVVHHARYLELAESSRHWWLKRRNLSCGDLKNKYRFSMTVASLSAKYQSAIFLEDKITVQTELSRLDRKGFDWTTNIISNNAIACQMRIQMVCVNVDSKSIMPVPSELIDELVEQKSPFEYRGLAIANS